MKDISIIEIQPGALKFSAGHLMHTSPNTRETLHGHDYSVSCAIKTLPQQEGFAVDLRMVKEFLQSLCDKLDYKFLLPQNSPYFTITESSSHWQINLNKQSFNLLKSDVVMLPVTNVTLEELAAWFVDKTMQQLLQLKNIITFEIKVYNGRNESAACEGTSQNV